MTNYRLPLQVAFLMVCIILLPGSALASTRGFDPVGNPFEGMVILLAIFFLAALFSFIFLLIDWLEQQIVERMKKNDFDALVKSLRSPWLGPKAARALGSTGDERALEPLIQSLGDRHAETRKSAAIALGDLGDDRAVEPLSCRLDDEYASVRESARQAIGMIKGRSNKLS